jgi:hypothetical protein
MAKQFAANNIGNARAGIANVERRERANANAVMDTHRHITLQTGRIRTLWNSLARKDGENLVKIAHSQMRRNRFGKSRYLAESGSDV